MYVGRNDRKSYVQAVKEVLQNENRTGTVQSIVMIFITLNLIYTAKKNDIKHIILKIRFYAFIIGVILGIFSSFLELEEDYINLVILIFFFSMTTKKQLLILYT